MKQFFSSLFLGLLFSLLTAGNAPGANSGHLLDQFELVPGEEISYLSFKGFFDPGQFAHIQISSGASPAETQILLPNTFINRVMLPERELTSFSQEGILERMTLEENITRAADGKVDFRVTLIVSGMNELRPVLDTEKSNSRQLTFALRPPKKKVGTIIGEDGTEMVVAVEEDLQPVPVSPREAMLLHPITALMSYRRSDQLNIAILNASPHVGGAQRLAVLLERQQKHIVEKRTGMKLKIVNISSVQEQTILPQTKIYFHANLLKAALILAEVLPGEQVLEPISNGRSSKLATDVEIYVGKNFK